ncbi:AraC family transcriptional regulator [Blautia schinkii]|nr:AraC family transcriptional regulator [Blautia schinkii]
MLNFHNIYRPLTSHPFVSDGSYMEYRPSLLLRPYISCFWTMSAKKKPSGETEVLVNPDTCMDIIVHINHTRQRISGYLCGIQDEPEITVQRASEDEISCFAIRFHFWSAHLFLKLKFCESVNRSVELNVLEKEWQQLFQPFFYIKRVEERIAYVEDFLLHKLNYMEKNDNLFNSIHHMINTAGSAGVKEICEFSCVSQRHMERMFRSQVGLTMKRAASLVRYQNVWREMATSSRFDVMDAVYRYGYTDQAHLLREFKRFHGVTPERARQIAGISRDANVVFLQYLDEKV